LFRYILIWVPIISLIMLIASTPVAYSAESEGACGNPTWNMSPVSGSAGSTVTLSEEVAGAGSTGDVIKGVVWNAGLSTEANPSHNESYTSYAGGYDGGPGIMSYSFTVPLDAVSGLHTVSLRSIYINPPNGTPSGTQIIPGNCRVFSVVVDSVSEDAYSTPGIALSEIANSLPNTGLSFFGFLAAGMGCLFFGKRLFSS